MENKRISFYDNLKFILIVLVVVGHFLDIKANNSDIYKGLFLFIYSFHMPLFIFISGLFYKNKKIKEKVVMFILIGLLTKIVLFLTSFILYGNTSFSLLNYPDLPWFMIALAFYIFISSILNKVDKKYLLFFSILIACITGYDSNIGSFLSLSRIIVFYPFFILGQMMDKNEIIKLHNDKMLQLISIFVIIIWIIVCFYGLDYSYILRPLYTGKNPYIVNTIFIKWGMLYRLICYITTICISLAILCIVPLRNFKFSKLGSKTLQVYFWHYVFLDIFIFIGLDRVFNYGVLGKFIWIIFAIVLSFILCLNIFSLPLNKIKNICKSI